MKDINCTGFENIQKIYDVYRTMRYDKVAKEEFANAKAALAKYLAPLYPTKEDIWGNLGEIYLTIDEFADSDYSYHFLADVLNVISKKFGKNKS